MFKKWSEVKWSEMRWNEVRWGEVKWIEGFFWSGCSIYLQLCMSVIVQYVVPLFAYFILTCLAYVIRRLLGFNPCKLSTSPFFVYFVLYVFLFICCFLWPVLFILMYISALAFCIRVWGQLPPGGDQIAVSKYRIVSYRLKGKFFEKGLLLNLNFL